jgi:sarcosine/dimethylglycine N-methyltransferase
MSDSEHRRSIDDHYGRVELTERILDRLRAAGKDLGSLSRDDLAGFDEFHTGGRPATQELARLAALEPGMRVLDAGSGIGGPARTLATERECHVLGLDLTGEFCRAAQRLTSLVRLSDRVSFQRGDACRMPYRSRQFDVVWSQNAMMNIEDKASLFHEVRRVLRPGGGFAFQAVFAGARGETRFPTFWAPNAALNFLVTPGEARNLLKAAGLVEEVWEDTSDDTLEQARKRRVAPPTASATELGRDVLVVADLAQKMESSVRNLEEGRVLTARSVWRRPATD